MQDAILFLNSEHVSMLEAEFANLESVESLPLSMEKHASFFELINKFNCGIIIENHMGNVVLVNNKLREFFQKQDADEQLNGSSFIELLDTKAYMFFDLEEVKAEISQFKGGQAKEHIFTFALANGDACRLQLFKLIEQATISYVYNFIPLKECISQDLIDQEKVKRIAKQNEMILDAVSDALVVTCGVGSVMYFNNQARKLFRWKEDQILSNDLLKCIEHLIHPESEIESFDDLLSEDAYSGIWDEELIINDRGTKKTLEIRCTTFIQESETCYSFLFRDITNSKKLFHRLLKNERKYQRIMADLNIGIVEVDLNDNIYFANDNFCKMSGFEYDELFMQNCTELLPFENHKEIIAAKRKDRAEGKSDVYEAIILNKNQEKRCWLISGTPIYTDDGRHVGSIGINLDITDQKNLEEELVRAHKQALSLVETKETFYSNLSHEIRTPMNAIVGLVAQLQEFGVSDDNEEIVHALDSAVKHMLHMVNEILDVSKIDGGHLALYPQVIKLQQLFEEINHIYAPSAQSKNLDFIYHYDSKIEPLVSADEFRLKQVVFNLLSNAIKFTHKGHVKLEVKHKGIVDQQQVVEVLVEDTGIGMSEEFVEKIFDKFSQEHRPKDLSSKGTGLGMTIAKEIVNLMDGNIRIESELNKGSKVYVMLKFPLSEVTSNTDVDATKEDEINAELAGIRALNIEDYEWNRLVMEKALQSRELTLIQSNNALDGLMELRENEVDVILLDLNLPFIDGFKFCQFVREKMGLNTPIIAITADSSASTRQKCADYGMEYLLKPYENTELIALLNKSLQSGKQVKEVEDEADGIEAFSDQLIKSLGGDHNFHEKMLKIFTTQGWAMHENLQLSLEEKEYSRIAVVLHKIRPSFEMLGLKDTAALILDCMKKIEKGNHANQELVQLHNELAYTNLHIYWDLQKVQHIVDQLDTNN